jgi:hypothetical protein
VGKSSDNMAAWGSAGNFFRTYDRIRLKHPGTRSWIISVLNRENYRTRQF